MPAPVKISILCAFRKSEIKVAKLSLISAHALLDYLRREHADYKLISLMSLELLMVSAVSNGGEHLFRKFPMRALAVPVPAEVSRCEMVGMKGLAPPRLPDSESGPSAIRVKPHAR